MLMLMWRLNYGGAVITSITVYRKRAIFEFFFDDSGRLRALHLRTLMLRVVILDFYLFLGY